MLTQDIQSNHSPFRLNSEQEMMSCFRPRDQKLVIPHAFFRWPVDVENYYVWGESSGVYTYQIFKKPEWTTPAGLVFKRDRSLGARGSMCDWCHAYGPADEIGMMTVAFDSRTTAGLHLCLDLSCITKLETIASVSGRSFDKMALGLFGRMGRFYESALRSKA